MTLVTSLYFPLKEKEPFLLGIIGRKASFSTGKLGLKAQTSTFGGATAWVKK